MQMHEIENHAIGSPLIDSPPTFALSRCRSSPSSPVIAGPPRASAPGSSAALYYGAQVRYFSRRGYGD
ncbi:MAG: hypothetical protein ACFE9A_20960, partial [Candidatus Hodarchaeota archaeon]